MFTKITSLQKFNKLNPGDIIKIISGKREQIYVLGNFIFGSEESRGRFRIDTVGIRIEELNVMGKMDYDALSLEIDPYNRETYYLVDDGTDPNVYDEGTNKVDIYIFDHNF